MTVCVAALANNGRAVVLVADKALTYGDNIYRPAMTGEGGVEKMLEIGERWKALLSDDPTVAEQIVGIVRGELEAHPDIGDSHNAMMDAVKEAYQQIREQRVVDEVLRPQMLTKDLWTGRSNTLSPLNEVFVEGVAREVSRFSPRCSLLVAGFDSNGDGTIFSVGNPGVIVSHALSGYGAIGIGQETALSRLLWAEAEEEDDLDMALYQAFEAKAYAEIIQGVGTSSDIWVMVQARTERVPHRILELLARVFAYSAQVPFKARKHWNPAPPPPKNWEATLKRYTKKLVQPPASQSGTVSKAE